MTECCRIIPKVLYISGSEKFLLPGLRTLFYTRYLILMLGY